MAKVVTPSPWAKQYLHLVFKATAAAAQYLPLNASTKVQAFALRVQRNLNPHLYPSKAPVTAQEANQAVIQAASLIRRWCPVGHPALDLLAKIPTAPPKS